MKDPRKLAIATAAALAGIFLLATLTGCSSLTPEERAFVLRSADRAVTIGLDKIATTHPQK